MSNFNQEPGKWRRRGALLGLVTAMAGVSVEASQAHPEQAQANAAALSAEGHNDNDRVAAKFAISKKAIESVLNSKKPDLFYGAVLIDESSTKKYPTVTYATPDKDPEKRISAPLAEGPIVVRDPLITKIDGVTYLIAYYRGFNDEANNSPYDAATDPADLAKFRYIDLDQAKKMGGVSYLRHTDTPTPEMVPTYTTKGQLGLKSDLMMMNLPMDLSFGFNDNNTLGAFVANNNLAPMPLSYKPPFEK